jgi:Glycosyl transferase family 2
MSTLEMIMAESPERIEHQDVEVVIPVYNEAQSLAERVLCLRSYLDRSFPFPAVITIADNASNDGTWNVARGLADEIPGIRAIRIPEKGRGRALRATWMASDAAVVAYMDVDLSTDLDALLPLVAPLLSGHSDVAIGTRLAPGSHVVRGPKRELISRCYNLLVRAALHNRFSDAQCGFKAMRGDVAHALLPVVQDNAWFFDTELLVAAERNGLRIHEVPVDWIDDTDSRVHIRQTVVDDLKGVWRLMLTPRDRSQVSGLTASPTRPVGESWLARFAGIGVVSTVAYVLLYVLLRGPLGVYAANAVALTVCTVANMAAHAKAHDRVGAEGNQRPGRLLVMAGGATVLATSLLLTTLALVLVGVVAPGSVWAEAVALVVASGLASLIRFVILKAWVFRTHLRQSANTPQH